MSSINNIKSGDRFGLLVVEAEGARSESRARRWLCNCDCGNKTLVIGSSLVTGNTKSCGCLPSKAAHKRFHKHGAIGTTEYGIWNAMKDRCRNPNNKKFYMYGARGITVCERWMNSFENFLADMGARPSKDHSIDRSDNSGNYEPSNCRWATRQEQQNNTRNNRLITYNGETKTLAQWCRYLSVDQMIVRSRLQYGWSVEDALTRPVVHRNRSRTGNIRRASSTQIIHAEDYG